MESTAVSEEQLQHPTSEQDIALLESFDHKSKAGSYRTKQDLQANPIVIFSAVDHSQHHPFPAQDNSATAYRVLTAAILFESILLGFPLSYGVFQDHYSTHFPTSSISPWIGVLSNGLPFLGAPAMAYLCQYRSLDLRFYIFAGWVLCVVSLLASVFCTSLQTLVLTQGLLYGLGLTLVDIPVLSLINTWFKKRRGIAYGLIFGGADLLAIAYTFVITRLLSAYGLKLTTAVLVAILFCIGGPPILLLKPRQHNAGRLWDQRCSISSADVDCTVSPQPRNNWSTQVSEKRYYQRSIYYIFTVANLLQALAFYLPFIYLPSFTTDLGYSASWSALVLSIANLAQVFGEIGFGKLSDKIHVKYLVIVSTTIASVSTFVLWGIFAARSMAVLLIFAFLFGCFGSGFLALWARMGTLFGEKDAQMVYSTMCFGRGLGSIVSGPISSTLFSLSGSAVSKLDFGAGKYAGLVFFVGACMASSAIVGVSGVVTLSWKNKANNLGNRLHSESASRLSWDNK